MAELEQYADLLVRRERLAESLAILNAEMATLEPAVLATLRNDPHQKCIVAGFELSRSAGLSVSLVNPAGAPAVFKANGLEHLVKSVESIHPSTLRAWVNRWYLQAPPPPDEVMAQLRIAETETIKAKRV